MKPEDIARFERNVDRSGGPDACHPWIRATDRDGYGVFGMSIDGVKRQYRANRVALFIEMGEWPTIARHACDNPPCCNPRHLSDGTELDNKRDMRERGRSLIGERNHKAVLTEADVLEIRASELSAKSLALRYGVKPPAIWKIKTGRTWRYLLPESDAA